MLPVQSVRDLPGRSNYMPVKVSLLSSTINIPLAFFLFKA